jgi:hypothetical protein
MSAPVLPASLLPDYFSSTFISPYLQVVVCGVMEHAAIDPGIDEGTSELRMSIRSEAARKLCLAITIFKKRQKWSARRSNLAFVGESVTFRVADPNNLARMV